MCAETHRLHQLPSRRFNQKAKKKKPRINAHILKKNYLAHSDY